MMKSPAKNEEQCCSTYNIWKIFSLSILISGVLTVFVILAFPLDAFSGGKRDSNISSTLRANNKNAPAASHLHHQQQQSSGLSKLPITHINPVHGRSISNVDSSSKHIYDAHFHSLGHSALHTPLSSQHHVPHPPHPAPVHHHVKREPTREFYTSEGIHFHMHMNAHHNETYNNSNETTTSYSPPSPPPKDTFYTHNVNWKALNPKNKIVAFYNMYIGKPDLYPSIVEEQVLLMNMTGLLDILDVVYYVTMGNDASTMPPSIQDLLQNTTKTCPSSPHSFASSKHNRHRRTSTSTHHNNHSSEEKVKTTYQQMNDTTTPMFVQVRNTANSVDETFTLSYLYDFCLANPDSKVLYFHNKGSYNYRGENVFFRQFLDCFVLNPECISALDEGYDTCGWRLSPVPTPHYSGNFWWARCDYVNRLVSPLTPYFNETFAEVSNNLPKAILSSERYFAEMWIASYPTVKPSDCMDHSIDTTFFCCYNIDQVPLSINVTSMKQLGQNSQNVTEEKWLCPNHARQFVANKNDLDDIHVYVDKFQPLVKERLHNLSLALSSPNYDHSNESKHKINKHQNMPIGSTCTAADVFVNGQYYAKTYQDHRGPTEHAHRLDIIDALRLRSLAWYGQEPTTLLDAVEKLDVLPILPSEAFIVNPHDHNDIRFYYSDHRIYETTSPKFSEVMTKEKEKEAAKFNQTEKIPIYDYLIKKLLIQQQRQAAVNLLHVATNRTVNEIHV